MSAMMIQCDGCGRFMLVPAGSAGWCWCPDCREDVEEVGDYE